MISRLTLTNELTIALGIFGPSMKAVLSILLTAFTLVSEKPIGRP